jgi:hypothetical protein
MLAKNVDIIPSYLIVSFQMPNLRSSVDFSNALLKDRS